MKKTVRILGISLAVILAGLVGALGYVKYALPNVGEAPTIKVSATKAQIERGRYLANHVNVCIDCHSTRDWSRFAGPPVAGTTGKGGDRFGPEVGFPGTFYAPNITPSGIGQWSDGEIIRAIASGVTREGKAIFPVMPHPAYGRMDVEDVKSIVAYVRTLKPIDNAVPASEADFPMNFILNTIPQKPAFQTKPDTTDVLAYGGYLVNAAGCTECHSQQDQGKAIAGLEFAGGREFVIPGGKVQSANITPDTKTGIGQWTKEAFVARFKAYDPARGYMAPEVKPGDRQSLMPWTMYAGMTESDLGAIYTYLKTLKPVPNRVTTFVASR
ncbi:c-type cytochrome [Spirosoma oryzicola]|uniref:c-type cytochrome n=1 Tax=Spirosoma oryzicola TaxID=2898794 RepID=UPI001E4FAA5B|nr:c-type cytochrome [Spirosoma oryzicola]UHG94257.1 cytochrome c [Spirosoma oryzicola]